MGHNWISDTAKIDSKVAESQTNLLNSVSGREAYDKFVERVVNGDPNDPIVRSFVDTLNFRPVLHEDGTISVRLTPIGVATIVAEIEKTAASIVMYDMLVKMGLPADVAKTIVLEATNARNKGA